MPANLAYTTTAVRLCTLLWYGVVYWRGDLHSDYSDARWLDGRCLFAVTDLRPIIDGIRRPTPGTPAKVPLWTQQRIPSPALPAFLPVPSSSRDATPLPAMLVRKFW
jgi:hypothetical protein